MQWEGFMERRDSRTGALPTDELKRLRAELGASQRGGVERRREIHRLHGLVRQLEDDNVRLRAQVEALQGFA